MLMHNPPHPGLIIKELCLEPLGVTVTDATKALGVSRKTLSSIINGKAGISPEMAVRLSIAFNTSSESWMNQQSQYDLWQAMTLKEPDNPNSIPFPPTRKPMTFNQALKAYTIYGAYFLHMEDKIGSIEIGKLADIVVLDKDIRKVDVEKIKDMKVLGTMLNGKFTHTLREAA